MKRIMVVAIGVAALVLVGIGFTTSVAVANRGATTTHFGPVSYDDSFFGPVVCSGEKIFKTGPKGFNKDSQTCTILFGFPAGTYTAADNGGWNSDSSPPSHSAGLFTTNVTMVVTDNGDGTSNLELVAYY